ncbi:MAG: hypothetical protein OXE50_10725, partial [Chloroflexi bacterium]|nr:hypothetical protein [Chloroflexota bacterium]
PPEEQQETQTGVDPVVLLVLSLMLLCGCGLMLTISSTGGPTLSGRVAFVVGIVGVLLGAVLLYRAVKRLDWW